MILRFLRVISPGILLAGLTIGTSHLVQSTRAGAGFGFQLAALILAVNLAKYPFFEYGHRYAAATGESLLHGYQRLGRWALVTYLVLHTISSVIGLAALAFVTAALAQNLLQLGLDAMVWSVLLIVASMVLVLAGRIAALDLAVKIMMAVLAVATVLALAAAVWHGPVATGDFHGPSPWTAVHLGFLIALMGWMPSPVEISVWQSLWLVAGDRAKGKRTTVADARADFNLGYGLSTVMALIFLSLGALVMYGSGEVFAESSVGFASQFVGMYTSTLGGWIQPFMAAAALATMLSTVLTSVDAAPRSLAVAQALLRGSKDPADRRLRTVWMIGVGIASMAVLMGLRPQFTQLIDLVMTISFLAAPVFALLNMRVMASEHVPIDHRPGRTLQAMAVVGWLFLAGFGLLYVIVRIGGFAG